jgi:hypothetical protein
MHHSALEGTMDEALSNFAFNFNLRRHIEGSIVRLTAKLKVTKAGAYTPPHFSST